MSYCFRLWLGFVCAIFLAVVGGCGGSAYEQTFEESLTKYRNNTGFGDISAARMLDLDKTVLRATSTGFIARMMARRDKRQILREFRERLTQPLLKDLEQFLEATV